MRYVLACLAAWMGFAAAWAAGAQEPRPVVDPAISSIDLSPVIPDHRNIVHPALWDPDRIEAFFDGAIETLRRTEDAQGVVVTVVQGGEVVFAKGYGYADAAETIPVDPAITLFRPASISKLFTWTAVMQLVEQYRINLDMDINVYLEGTGVRVADAFDTPVTMRHIMTHTAGFEERVVGVLFPPEEDVRPLGELLSEYQPARVRPPGETASYSNYATALAGLVVQNVSGQFFDNYVEEHIFAPLGMTRSSFREPVPAAMADGLAQSVGTEAGLLVEKPFESISDHGPAGSLSATALDMAKFMIAHLDEGGPLLSPKTTAMMHGRAFGHHPDLPGMALGFYEETAGGHHVIGHGGDTLYFHSRLILLPERDLGIFISVNSSAGVPIRTEVPDTFLKTFFTPLGPSPVVESNAEYVARYAGAYRNNRYSHTTIEKLTALGSEIQLSAMPDGTLLLGGISAPRRLVPAQDADDLFMDARSNDLYGFGTDEESGDVDQFYVGNAPVIAFDRLAWWETSTVQLTAGGLALLFFVNVLFGSIANIGRVLNMSPAEMTARGVLILIAVCHIGFVGALAAIVTTLGNDIVLGWPPVFGTLFWVPLIAAGLTALAALFAVTAWREGYWGVVGRVRYSAGIVVSLLLLAIFHYWNLLGFNF